MAKTYEAPFAQNIKTGVAVVTAANTAFNSAATNGNLSLLFQAGAEGASLNRLSAIPLQTITATQIQVFRKKANGNIVLWKTRLMPAYTLATNNENPAIEFTIDPDNPWSLEPNEQVLVGIGVAATGAGISFWAECEDF